MNLLLIGNFAPDRQESMQRFTHLLEDGLQARGHRVTTWSPEPGATRLLRRYRYGGVSKYLGYIDKFVFFPRRVRRRLRGLASAPDAVHIIDHANAVYGPCFAGLPLLATCHDLLQIRAARGELPQQRVGAAGRRYQEWIRRHLGRLPAVACVSEKTRSDLLRLTGIPADQVTLIANGLNYPYQSLSAPEASERTRHLLHARGLASDWLDAPGGYVLNVGGGQWYKNRAGSLAIMAHLRRKLQPPPRLVMVGKPLSLELQAQAAAAGLDRACLHLEGVSNAELEALYARAEGLLFPSWEEGFGWPVAEAQACGCPVFTSDRPPMNEVGGDAAVYFDPADPESAAQRIVAAWPERPQLRLRGLAAAGRWEPDLMIARYEQAYRTFARRANFTRG